MVRNERKLCAGVAAQKESLARRRFPGLAAGAIFFRASGAGFEKEATERREPNYLLMWKTASTPHCRTAMLTTPIAPAQTKARKMERTPAIGGRWRAVVSPALRPGLSSSAPPALDSRGEQHRHLKFELGSGAEDKGPRRGKALVVATGLVESDAASGMFEIGNWKRQGLMREKTAARVSSGWSIVCG